MNRVMMAALLAGTVTLGACATTDDGYADNDTTLESVGTGAAVGAAAGAVGGALIGGVSPVEGAIAGAVVGGVVGAIVDNNNDGYDDSQYYDRNGDGYYDERYDANGRPMPVRYAPPPPPAYRSGERG